MTALEAQLEGIRSSATAKPKFSFQRKTNKSSSSAPSTMPKSSMTVSQVPSAHPASTFYTLQKHAHQYLTSSSLPPPTSGQPQSDLTISDLDHCIVNLCSSTSQTQPDLETPWSHELTALHIRNLRSTIVILPDISGSILLHNLEQCIIVASCHQVKKSALYYPPPRQLIILSEIVPDAHVQGRFCVSEYTLKSHHRTLFPDFLRWIPSHHRSIIVFRRGGKRLP